MAVIETSENQAKLALQTHYFKASYKQIKEAYLEALEQKKHNIVSVNDDYSEIYSEVPHMEVVAKIIMQDPKETSIDFYINSEYLFGSTAKAIKFIEDIYAYIQKKYELKGVSLHR